MATRPETNIEMTGGLMLALVKRHVYVQACATLDAHCYALASANRCHQHLQPTAYPRTLDVPRKSTCTTVPFNVEAKTVPSCGDTMTARGSAAASTPRSCLWNAATAWRTSEAAAPMLAVALKGWCRDGSHTTRCCCPRNQTHATTGRMVHGLAGSWPLSTTPPATEEAASTA